MSTSVTSSSSRAFADKLAFSTRFQRPQPRPRPLPSLFPSQQSESRVHGSGEKPRISLGGGAEGTLILKDRLLRAFRLFLTDGLTASTNYSTFPFSSRTLRTRRPLYRTSPTVRSHSTVSTTCVAPLGRSFPLSSTNIFSLPGARSALEGHMPDRTRRKPHQALVRHGVPS